MALDVTQVIAELRPKLRSYLESKGVLIDNAGFFRCIHPDHDDKHPSCSIGGSHNEEVFHCFSRAGHDGNIFTAAHWLDNQPIAGEEFFNDTLKKLADQFGIPYEPMELSPDVKREVAKRRAYRDAVGVLNSMTYHCGNLNASHVGIKHLLDRGINQASIRTFGAVVLESFSAYIDAMHGLGWTDDEFLKEAGLAHKGIFDRHSVLFPIYDKRSRPVGFVSRNTRFNPNDHGSMKYINSNNSDIYCKGNILFNYNNVYKKTGPLYIVEGYLDAVYLEQCGMEKVVAIGATILTDSHIEMLLEDNQNNIILCLDSDEGGRKGTEIALERMAPLKAFSIQIIDLPTNDDPDSYVRANGVDKFLEYETKTPFKWTLEHTTSFNADLVEVAKKAIPAIATEDSAVARLKMIRELSQYTSVPESEIKRDVESLLNKHDSKYLEEVRNINQAVQFKLNKRSLNDTRTILREAMVKLDGIDEKFNQKSDLQGDFFDRLSNLETKIRGGDYKYGLKSPSFSKFQNVLDGVPFWANLIWIGGRPSAGKTAFMTALSMDILDANDDAAIFYQSIDDNLDLLMTKMLAVRTGLTTSEIRQFGRLKGEDKDAFEEGILWLRSVRDRIIIADASHGNTVDKLESHMSYFCRQFPEHKKLYLLDNFHKLSMTSRTGNQRSDAISDTSSQIKNISLLNDVPIMATVELRKLQGEKDRPTRQDMQGSNKLDYDADVIALVHNDRQVNRDSNITWTGGYKGKVESMPYVEIDIVKNKINGRDGMIPYQFNKFNMRMTEDNYDTWLKLKQSTPKRREYNF